MFRECFFEYAGQSSQPYNLMLCYVSNTTTDFDSGGKFDLKTDTLPRSHETLLYGKDYSAQPLSFDVEFVNIDDNIPLQQMTEIKNWLFGQDGWKTFRLLDDRQDYRLKCIFEPGEDIVDGGGYKGLRCTLKNVSPFWYGEEKEVEVSGHWITANYTHSRNVVAINIPENACAGVVINPQIILDVDKTDGEFLGSDVKTFTISSCDATTIDEGKAWSSDTWTYPDTSELSFSISYIGNKGESDSHDIITINTKYVIMTSQRFTSHTITPTINMSNPLPIFRLKHGTNICRIQYGWNYRHIYIRYTPVFRLGAF